MYYSEFGSKIQKCKECKWTGLGKEAEIHESWEAGADYHCPECGDRFGFIAWNTTSDTFASTPKHRKLPFGFRTMRLIKAVRDWIGKARR